MKNVKFKLTLCDGTACIQSRSKELHQRLDAELEKHGLKQAVSIHLSGCLGMCKKGPILIVNPGYIKIGRAHV